ncbi:MAG: diguanylate cyclase domain-containing protein [Cognaticolwellia sp.]
MTRISIKNKIWFSLLFIICVFITLINTIIGLQIRGINTQEIFKSMTASALAYQRYSQQTESFLLLKAQGVSQIPHLKATLSIPDLDADTLAYTMSDIHVSADISLLLVLDENAVLKYDKHRQGFSNGNLQAMPGIDNAFQGQSYFGYWQYQNEYYQVAISPSTSHNQLLGIVILGKKLTDPVQLSIIEDVSSAHALVRTQEQFFSLNKLQTTFSISLQQQAYPVDNLTFEQHDNVTSVQVILPEINTEQGTFYAISVPLAEHNAELILYKEQTSLLSRLNLFQRIMLMVSIFTLLLGIFISWFISFKITRPLSEIMAVVKKYGHGDFRDKITKISSDELGDLSLAFNQMGDDIVESRKNLLDRKVAEDNMRKLAYVDELTRLPNRRYFMEKLEKLITNAQTVKTKFAVVFIDVDNFKHINDSLGHDFGDELLVQFSRRLERSIRGKDSVSYATEASKSSNVYRLGGDEFTILLADVEKEGDIIKIAQRIIEAFIEPFSLNQNEVFVTGSLGISVFPEHGSSCTTLLKHADIAMYAAKNKGKNAYMIYAPTNTGEVRQG